MSTLYLHIGTPKTGTTAIQHFMWRNRKQLRKQGVNYPNFQLRPDAVPEKRNAHFLIAGLTQKNLSAEELKAAQNACYDRLFMVLDEYEKVVISDEMIWHGCNHYKKFWQNLSKKIKDAGHTLKIIVYLRRQDEFIQSYWKYKVLSNETMSFFDYINSNKYNFFPLQYHTHLTKIANAVGKENILVRVYEKEQYEGPQPTIISDFLHTIGITLDESFKDENAVKNTNIDFICTELKRRLNVMPEFNDKKSTIRSYMTLISERNVQKDAYQVSSLFPDRESQDQFLEKYEEENAATARDFLGRENGVLFRAPVHYITDEQQKMAKKYLQLDVTKAQTPQEVMINDYLNICGDILLQMQTDIDARDDENAMLRDRIRELEGTTFNRVAHKSANLMRKVLHMDKPSIPLSDENADSE